MIIELSRDQCCTCESCSASSVLGWGASVNPCIFCPPDPSPSVALLWMFSNSFMPFQHCAILPTSGAGGDDAQSRGNNSLPHPVAVLGLLHPRVLFIFNLVLAGTICWWLKSEQRRSFSFSRDSNTLCGHLKSCNIDNKTTENRTTTLSCRVSVEIYLVFAVCGFNLIISERLSLSLGHV